MVAQFSAACMPHGAMKNKIAIKIDQLHNGPYTPLIVYIPYIKAALKLIKISYF